jgi:hypothetical protein
MTTNNNPSQPDVAGVPERVWIEAAGIRSARRTGVGSFYIEKNDTAGSRDIEFVRATQPATTPSDSTVAELIEALEGAERNAQMSSTRAYKIRKLLKRARSASIATTPPDVTERARRAVSTLRAANILLADPTEAELIEATAIIAAEFGEFGEGEK